MKLVLLFLVTTIIVGLLICLFLRTGIKNPEKGYWFHRSDAGGKQIFNKDKNYLYQVIIPPDSNNTTLPKCTTTCEGESICYDGICVPYINAEIYNNPCCSYDKDLKDACKQINLDTLKQLCSSGVIPANSPICTDTEDVAKLFCDLYRSVCSSEISDRIPSKYKKDCHLVYNPAIGMDTDPLDSIREIFFNTPYLYRSIKTRVKAKNLKDGSRGWGFWNTTPIGAQMAWFMHQDGICPPNFKDCPEGKEFPLNGFYIMIVTDDYKNKTVKLPDLDEDWHDYEIIWKKDKLIFKIDNKTVHSEEDIIPTKHMAFHFWIDNAVFAPWHAVQNMRSPREQWMQYITIN